MTCRPLPVLIGLAMLFAPGIADAQSMDVRGITRAVGDEVCAPFVRSGDITAARAAAGALGYRVVLADADGYIVMEKPHGGRLLLDLRDTGGLCAISMAEATVRQIDEAAAPTMRRLGFRRMTATVDGSRPGVVWRGERGQAVAAPGPDAALGSTLSFTFTAPHRRDAD